MRTFVLSMVGLAALAFSASPAAADTLIPFTAVINGAQENPPVASPSTGEGLFLFNSNNLSLCYRISYTALSSLELVAHIHGPAAPGTNAPILHNISPIPSPIGSPKHGCVTLTSDEAKSLKKGLLYFNVHTANFTGGESRGQILPVKAKYKNVPALASPDGAFLE
jgi:hypothetical protein